MTFFMGPTGSIVRGHVLDCAVAPLERKLRELDSQLYLRWNPKKLKRWGCWEIRRLPNQKTLKDVVVHGGNTLVVVDYVENNFENHILDVAYLNYDVITRLKKMDTWAGSERGRNFLDQMDSVAASVEEKTKEAALKERRYELKQQKTMVRDLMDYTLSGGDPSLIANYWNP